MSDSTLRFGLPLRQAQKEIDHNEALALIDGALHPLVQTIGDAGPPTSPALGQVWAVGPALTGDWAGQAGTLALRTGGGWRFITPPMGMSVWNAAGDRPARWDGTQWRDGELRAAQLLIGRIQVVGTQQAAIAAPAAGAVIDA